jgi:hypothetical protein
MSKDIILFAAIGAAVLLVMKKQAVAAAVTQGAPMTEAQKIAAGLLPTKAQNITANVNGDMWARLMGEGWRNLLGAQNADGTKAFVTNSFGQVTTSDGKPVGSGDPIADYANIIGGVPVAMPTPYTDALFPISTSTGFDDDGVLGWVF